MGMKNSKKLSAVILAAGSGTRMNSSITKQRMLILGESVLHRSVKAFDSSSLVSEIIVVARADEIELLKSDIDGFEKPIRIIAGGQTRAESARLGFMAISEKSDYLMIHDAARCLVTTEIIDSVALSAFEHGAATAATAVSDTIKRSSDGKTIDATIPRNELYAAQTPQAFNKEVYTQALEVAQTSEFEITDDNMMAEIAGAKIHIVECGRENIKITTPSDIEYAEYVIRKRECMTCFRVGHGYDVHRFVEGRSLILGGVKIEYEKGLLGHSDADVLTHAIMDALLGAAGLGDIGRHFPDTSEEYRGISSIVLLERVSKLLIENKFRVNNVDATLVLQSPKISVYVDKMRTNIAEALGIPAEDVNIKATTEEHLGFTGSGEGAAAHAVATLTK